MKLVELTADEFDRFACTHPLRNYCQTSSYAKFMGEQGFSFDYVGFKDNGDTLVAASLIVYKSFGFKQKYAYAPKGFLIDYYNVDLLKTFVENITKRYRSKGVVLLKINPEIIIGELKAKQNFTGEYNQNVKIIDDLKTLNFRRRRELEPFELIMPRLSPYVNLKKYQEESLEDDARKKIAVSKARGLVFEVATPKDINSFFEIIRNNSVQTINYYRNLLNIFEKSDCAELLLVKVDYKEFLLQARASYDIEQERNNYFNQMIQKNPSDENLNLKMESDATLLQLKDNIVEATEGLKKKNAEYVAGAVIIKYLNRANIIASGYDTDYSHVYPFHFLYSNMIEKYEKEHDYLDLNGFALDASENSIYEIMNEFKLSFNPTIYEFIGEFDIIFDESKFKRSKDALANELKSQRLN